MFYCIALRYIALLLCVAYHCIGMWIRNQIDPEKPRFTEAILHSIVLWCINAMHCIPMHRRWDGCKIKAPPASGPSLAPPATLACSAKLGQHCWVRWRTNLLKFVTTCQNGPMLGLPKNLLKHLRKSFHRAKLNVTIKHKNLLAMSWKPILSHLSCKNCDFWERKIIERPRNILCILMMTNDDQAKFWESFCFRSKER